VPSDKEAESSLHNLISRTPLEEREKYIKMGLYLIETGTIKMDKDYTRRELTKLESQELNSRFTYHAPKEGQAKVYEELRSMARELGAAIMSTQEMSRERNFAISKLEECIMWANAGIARNT
jgi:hypothetical protein